MKITIATKKISNLREENSQGENIAPMQSITKLVINMPAIKYRVESSLVFDLDFMIHFVSLVVSVFFQATGRELT